MNNESRLTNFAIWLQATHYEELAYRLPDKRLRELVCQWLEYSGEKESGEPMNTPLYIVEMNGLGIGIEISKETIEKFSLETLRSMGEYTLYYSCHTSNAYLTYDDRIMAIGPSFVLEPFMTLREGLSLKKKKIILDK